MRTPARKRATTRKKSPKGSDRGAGTAKTTHLREQPGADPGTQPGTRRPATERVHRKAWVEVQRLIRENPHRRIKIVSAEQVMVVNAHTPMRLPTAATMAKPTG